MKIMQDKWVIPLFVFSLVFSAAASAEKTLIIYFSQPGNVSLEGADGVSGASILEKNNQTLGNNQYIAQLIQSQTQADIFRIESDKPYPVEHDPLLEAAQAEKRNGIRPNLKSPLPDLAQYDTIFIGYPIWWYQMPMIMYSVFEQYDFSGKTLIPFTVHGGSRFSGSIRVIRQLQPNATVIERGLSISRDDVTDEDIPEEVSNWLNNLPINEK